MPAAARRNSIRIVSLIPAGTEIVCALGAGDSLVGVSHECDHPPEILGLPRITTSMVEPGLPGVQIDAEVRRRRSAGQPVIGVDGSALATLQPDLIITQDLCQVCAVADGEAHRLSSLLNPVPRTLSLRARDLNGIWEDILALGTVINRESEARSLVAELKDRVRALRTNDPPVRPRVICIEWLDPLFLAGHWVPEMIEIAGGEDVGAAPGSHSAECQWEAIAGLGPDVAIIMLCGFGLARSLKETEALADTHPLRKLRCPVWLLDGNAFTSRGGPRVVNGIEIVQHALHGWPHPALVNLSNPHQDVHGTIIGRAAQVPA